MSVLRAPATPDPLLPPPARDGTAPGFALALLVHAGLLAALTLSVDWRSRSPEVLVAELWSSVPQPAAPPAPPPPAPAPPPEPAPAPKPAPPPPPPAAAQRDADIATEQARQRAAEQERREREARERRQREEKAREEKQRAEKAAQETKAREDKARAEKLAAQRKAEAERAAKEAAEAKAEEERLAQQREANLRRMMGQAGAAGSTQGATAATAAAPSAAYTARLIALIRGNLVFPGALPDDIVAEVEVRAGASGSIIARRLVRSSGHKEWDEAVIRAIDRTGTLPRDSDGRVPPVLLIAFRPKG